MPLEPIARPLHFDTPEDCKRHLKTLLGEFQRSVDLPVGAAPTVLPGPPMAAWPRKVALVVGHNEQRQGAYSPVLATTEFAFWSERIDKIAQHVNIAGFDVVTFFRKPHGNNYKVEMNEVAGRVMDYQPDAIFCLHFNSFYDEQAHGAEVLSLERSRAPRSRRAAVLWLNAWAGATGLERRGVKEPNRGKYGMEQLEKIAPTVLCEPFFGSNPSDCGVVSGMGSAKFSRLMGEAIAAGMGALE